ncbi:ArsR/SmtB family transcription factor [Clostridium sp.]|jgi:ArsR family transcriptional regulator|uniref:ArsR/SmtB family transcription factor n=1 Tax=Clostridium sp. TaxID=1506 RepID=UPI0035A1953C
MNQEELSVKIFKALGHPIRYKIVKFLFDGPKCVCKLNEDVEFSQANLSQHLKILKDAGILASEKIGMNIHYRISNDEIKKVIECVDRCVLKYINNFK